MLSATKSVAALTDPECVALYEPLAEGWGKGIYIPDKVVEMRALLPINKGTESVLDLGCGLCAPFIFLQRIGHFTGRVIGIDPSEGMLNEGRKLAESVHADIELVQGWAQNIPLAENSVDMVHCVDALHWSEEWLQAIGEIVRVAKKDIFIVASPQTRRRSISMLRVIEELISLGTEINEAYLFPAAQSSFPRWMIRASKNSGDRSGLVIVNTVGYET